MMPWLAARPHVGAIVVYPLSRPCKLRMFILGSGQPMTDFSLIIDPPYRQDLEIHIAETDLLAFRIYERLSGIDPTLDRSKSELASFAPEDKAPESPFDTTWQDHAPPILNHETRTQPPYYLRILISPSALPPQMESESLLGCAVCLNLTDETGPATRHIRGLILRVLDRTGPFGHSSAVELQVYPSLWALSLSEKSRVWLNLDSLSLLKQLVTEYLPDTGEKATVNSNRVSSAPNTRESVIQWDESDFQFLSRLLERDGLFYYFTHDDRQTYIHVADSRTAYAEGHLPHRTLAFQPTTGAGGELFDDHVSFLTTQVQSLPRRYRVADYNPLQWGTRLDYGTPAQAHTAMEIYDFPGDVGRIEDIPEVARRRYMAVAASARRVTAASRCPFVSAGHVQSLPALDERDDALPVRVTQAVHELVRDESGIPYYRNWFEAIDGEAPYAPAQRTPIPYVTGTHNATVISALPEETVDVDEHSRALILFRWDRQFKPVRARLGQPWAGAHHGASMLPRHGDEVLVGFIQGNTERPIILTSLHHSSTPKKVNPTLMETRGLQGSIAPGHSRQNRYATVLHNTEGNAIYFNDTSDKELLKVDAYKDFVIEVGHKVAHSPSGSNIQSTNESGAESSLDESGSQGNFIPEKENRGQGLIRSYGDFTIWVGKLAKVTSEEDDAANWEDERDKDNSVKENERGDLRMYIMGDNIQEQSQKWSYTKNDSGNMFKASWEDPKWGASGLSVTATQGVTSSLDISAKSSFEMSSSFTSKFGIDSTHQMAGSWLNRAGVNVTTQTDIFSIAMFNPNDWDIGGLFGKLNTSDYEEEITANKLTLVTDPILVQLLRTTKKTYRYSIVAINTIISSLVSLINIIFSGTAGQEDKDTVANFLETYPWFGLGFTILSTLIWAAGIVAVLILAGLAKVGMKLSKPGQRKLELDIKGLKDQIDLQIGESKKPMQQEINKLQEKSKHIKRQQKSVKRSVKTAQDGTTSVKIQIKCTQLKATSAAVGIKGAKVNIGV